MNQPVVTLMAVPIVLALVLAAVAPAAAQDKVLGLLVLPEVFGHGPCQQFEPRAISLHDAPGMAAPIGSIEVDQHWSYAPHGGCEGLKVSAHSGRTRAELPTLEYANESPEVVGLGWVAAHAPSGEPTVWFSSRGC